MKIRIEKRVYLVIKAHTFWGLEKGIFRQLFPCFYYARRLIRTHDFQDTSEDTLPPFVQKYEFKRLEKRKKKLLGCRQYCNLPVSIFQNKIGVIKEKLRNLNFGVTRLHA
jgi:hypothetical protein